MPYLVTVVFRMGFPGDQQSIPVGGDFGPMPKFFMNDGMLFRDIETLEEVLKLVREKDTKVYRELEGISGRMIWL